MSFPLDQRQVNFFSKGLVSWRGVLPSRYSGTSYTLKWRGPLPTGQFWGPCAAWDTGPSRQRELELALHLGPSWGPGRCVRSPGLPVVLSGLPVGKGKERIDARPRKDSGPSVPLGLPTKAKN